MVLKKDVKGSVRMRGAYYMVSDIKDYPVSTFDMKRIKNQRVSIINMKSAIKSYKERIEHKTNMLEELFDELVLKVEKYEERFGRKTCTKIER